MGKLFTLLLVAISCSGFGQVYQTFNAYGWEVNRIKLNNGLTLPTYAGLPSIATVSNSSVDLRGTLIYNTNDSTIYGWSGTQWRAVGSGGGGSYTAAFGMALTGSAFRVDSTVITSQARTSAGLATKQPLEDQRLSTTNSPIFNRIITSNTTNTDAVQMSFINTTYNAMTFFQDGNSFAQLAAIGDNAGLGARNGNFEFNLNRKKSIAFQVKSIEQFRIDSGNVALPQGALTMGSSIIVFGNSIPNGVGASVSDSSYVKVIDSIKRYSSTNNASNGSCIGDQAGVIFSEVTAPTKQYIYDLSVNDYRLHTSANHYTFYKYGLMDEVAWLGLRDSSKIKANSTSVTYTGTWTTPGVYGGLTRGSSTVASTASMRLKGSTILVSTINQNANTGGFTISVDGSVKYTWARPATNIVSVNGATFAPYLIPITGLYDSMHTVVITVTSITGGDAVYFNWAAGTSGLQSGQFEPSVYVNDASRQTSAGYATNGGSDALCAAYNAIIYDAVDFLASIGVNCVQVRGGSALNPLTDLSDGIHPNDRGHRIEAYSYINKMNGIIYPKDRQRAGGSYTNGAINYNSNSLGFGTSGQVLTSGGSGVIPTWTTVSGGGSTDTTSLSNRINAKQNTLVNGTNIKTINGNNVLGSGDLTIGGGGGMAYLTQSTAPTGSDTTKFWVNNSISNAGIWPIQEYYRTAWRTIRWYDSAANYTSRLKPLTILATGQSNMDIRGDARSPAPDSRVLFWNGTAWVVWNLGANNNLGFQFAKNIAQIEDRVVRVVHSSLNGSTITNWNAPSGARYTDIQTKIAASQTSSVDLILWRQGEAENSETLLQYKVKFDTVVNRFRNETWFNKINPIIVGGLDPANYAGGSQKYFETINENADASLLYASNEGLTTSDGSHFDGAAIDSSGRRMAAVYLYGKTRVSPTLNVANDATATWTKNSGLKVQGGGNVAIGNLVLNHASASGQNIGIGTFVSTMTGIANSVAIGHNANSGSAVTSESVSIGTSAGGLWPDAGNIAIGHNSGGSTSTKTVAVGWNAAQGNAGASAVHIGGEAGQIAAGNYQVNIGYRAGKQGSATGTGNIAIGWQTGFANSFNNVIQIGASVVADKANQVIIGASGTTEFRSANYRLNVGQTLPTAQGNVLALNVTSGQIELQNPTPYTAKTATYTILNTDNTIDATSGTFTATLPTAVGVSGKIYTIKNSGAGVITVATTSSQTIDGSTTYSLATQYKYVTVQSNGANWIVIANN